MKIIAVYNMKGGVGKTATAVNLAYLSAYDGGRTLLWDLDPQGAASFYFRIASQIEGGGKALFRGKTKLDSVIKGSDFEGLDLIPADLSYRNMDFFLEKKDKTTSGLKELAEPLSQEYDYLFLDCPPSLSLVSENIMEAADVMLVPVIPTTLSSRTLNQLTHFCHAQKFKPPLILPFFSMVDRRKKLHTDLMQEIAEAYPQTLRHTIPYSSEVEKMGVFRDVVIHMAPNAKASLAFRELWEEIKIAKPLWD